GCARAGPNRGRAPGAVSPAAKVVRLDAGFALLPGTRALLDAIDAADPRGERMGATIDFVFDHPVMLRALAAFSQNGPIAFIETAYDDGKGAQAASACVDGKVVTSAEGEGRPI